MTEMPKQLQAFIARDIVYLVGGGCVVGSFLYALGRFPEVKDGSIVLNILAAGIAYVLGYALRDLFCILRIVTTSFIPEPNRVVKWLYRRFVMESWRSLDGVDWSQARHATKDYLSDEYDRADFERLIALMMIGTTMGPCCLVSAVTILVGFSLTGGRSFDLVLGLSSLALGLVFVALAWLKAAQYTQETATAILASISTRDKAGRGCGRLLAKAALFAPSASRRVNHIKF